MDLKRNLPQRVFLGPARIAGITLLLLSTSAPITALTLPIDTDDPAGSALERTGLTASELEAAERQFEEDLRNESDATAAYLGLSAVREKQGDLIGALRFAKQAIQNKPESFVSHVLAGRLLALLGKTPEALEELRAARQLEPENPAGYLIPAVLLRKADRPEEAISLLEDAIEKGLEQTEISVELGFLLLDAADFERSLELAESAFKTDPNSGELALIIGLALAEDPARRQDAPTWMRRALKLGVSQPNDVELKLAEMHIASEEFEAALASLERVAIQLPNHPQVHYQLGIARRAVGDIDGAKIALERFQELKSRQDSENLRIKEIGTILNEAQSLATQNQLPEAIGRLQELLEEHPTAARALTLQAKVFFSMRKTEEALDSISKARRLVPGKIENHYLEGLFLSRLGRLDEAQSALERVLTLDNTIAEAHALAGEIGYRQGDFALSVRHFGMALDMGLDDPTLRLHYAESLEKLGRLEESQTQMRAYRQLKDG